MFAIGKYALASCAIGLTQELFATDIELQTSSIEDDVRAEYRDLESSAAIGVVTTTVSRASSSRSNNLLEVHLQVHGQIIGVLDL